MSKNKPTKQFSELWDPHGEEIKSRVKQLSTINKLSIAAPFAVAASHRDFTKEQLAIITGLSGLSLAQSKAMDYKGAKMTLDMIDDQSVAADSDLQNMADKLFAKAGLKDKPVVRIVHAKAPKYVIGPAGDQVTKQANHSIGIVPKGMIKDVSEPTILIGHKTLSYLTKAEMAAVLAHETSHALVQGETLAPLTSALNKAGTSVATGITFLSIFKNKAAENGFLNAKAALALLAGEVGRSITFSQLQQTDENRADRNSLALFPHKTALLSALHKIVDNVSSDLGVKKDPKKEPSGLSKIFNVFATHPSVSKREENMEVSFREVERFYTEHGFDVNAEIKSIAGKKPNELCNNLGSSNTPNQSFKGNKP
jgi:Zn-dependent protease with chaperone function